MRDEAAFMGASDGGDGGSECRICLRSVNPHILCKLCKGYMIDATTITECLHTFCKSCIVRHLEENVECPECNLVIHQSHPLNYISHDRTMQDIVYKLVPNLLENEQKRIEEFYKEKGLPMPKTVTGEKETEESKASSSPSKDCKSDSTTAASEKSVTNTPDNEDYHMSDEQVNVCLECMSNQFSDLERRYIRCSVQVTITHLKKFLALKLFKDIQRFRDYDVKLLLASGRAFCINKNMPHSQHVYILYVDMLGKTRLPLFTEKMAIKQVDVLCDRELLGKDHTLKFILVTRWRNKEDPLLLGYRPHMDI